jgi:lysophospholipid acyltransferase (LPLAT)-like uncharacterized protein
MSDDSSRMGLFRRTHWRGWLRRRLLPPLVFFVYWLLFKTWRIEYLESDDLVARRREKRGFALAHWHGDELALMPVIRRYGIATMASASDDGGLAAYIVRAFGGAVSRGSSSRNAVSGFLGLVKLCRRERRPVSFAVDGPRGPRLTAKPGVLEFSRIVDFPIFPLSADADRKWTQTRSWNQAFLPKPFARVTIVVGSDCSPKNPDAPLAQRLKDLETAILNAKQQAGKHIAALQGRC